MAEQNIRLRIVSHLIAAAAGSALTFALVARAPGPEPQPRASEPQQAAPKVNVPKIPVIPTPPPPLDRAALLSVAAAAADAAASGSAMPGSSAALVGRSFILRMPFGCRGEMTDDAKSWAGWVFNPKSRALRLSARTTDLAGADWVTPLAGEMKFDAVEGFWIQRPWTRADRCARGEEAMSDAMPASSDQRLAIAQFFSPQSPRNLRRGDRPYASTIKLEEGETPSPQGYQIQLEGRITGFPDGQPVHCIQQDSAMMPRCVIAAEFERVAFIAPGKDEPLVEWR
ncbi:hypothetical protein [Sphingobium chungbukense]|uniref:Uncharacterized protein n=1 Tax=Sphingobium chungbukense TaxID=56193 RepID=A0A0M3AHI0_9SPHN|nr:hypothetical protein [Sphingobium chungbukense]KKW89483.1 hypothetical protein YP76_24825 [Sphingobium chungbukense]